jgi:predicted dehydrogenase
VKDRTETGRELRVGVIGLGFAGSTHLDAYRALPGATVVALAGQEPARLAELAETREVPDTYADWQDLVARDDLDIVSIGVPNALHHPIAVAALDSGKHVFCEKPLATTAALAEEMVAAARRADRVLEVAFNHRRRADVAFIARYLAEHPIGRVYHARASWLRRQGVPGIDSWFTDKQAAGGGPLIDLGSHVLDIALSLLGEPRVTHVSAVAYNELGRAGRGGRAGAGGPVSARSMHEFGVEDFASALLRLDSGASLQLEAAWASYSKADDDIEVELLGSEGGVRLNVHDHATEGTITVYGDALGAPVVSRPDVPVPAGHHRAVIAEFLDAIRAGEDRSAPRYVGHYGEYALHRSRVIDAAYASAAAGHEVTLAEAEDHDPSRSAADARAMIEEIA